MNQNIFKIPLTMALVLLFFGVGIFSIEAAEINGHAWSSNIGWIKMKGNNYGVIIDSTGNLSGHAWSSNIGWISFQSSSVTGCPSTVQGSCNPRFSGDKIIGWARVCSVFETGCSGVLKDNSLRGGFTGWILFPDSSTGVKSLSGNLQGYAWGGGGDSINSAIVGWIDFQYATTDYGTYLPDLEYFRVNYSFVDYCNYPNSPPIRAEWEYNNFVHGYDQESFEIQVLSGVNVIHTETGGSGPRAFDMIGPFEYGKSYTVRIKIKNSDEQWSDWITAETSGTLPAYHYPIVRFDYNPSEIKVDEPVQFEDISVTYNNITLSRLWTFPDGNPGTSNQEKPSVVFSTGGKKNVSLTVTDDDNFFCTKTEEIGVKFPLPDWKEVTPFGKVYNFFKKILS
jgi:hypothetical protein